MWGFKTKKNRALANRIFNLITDPALARKYNGDLQSPKGADRVRAFIYVLKTASFLSYIEFVLVFFIDKCESADKG